MDTNEKQLRQEWRTPSDFILAVSREFMIDVDVCASNENCIVNTFFSRESDGLSKTWFSDDEKTAWCNPGFSSARDWVEKAVSETQCAVGATAILLLPAAPSTKWWDYAVNCGAEIRLLSPRVQFVAPAGIAQTSNPRENALLIFRSGVSESKTWTWRWK